MSLSRFTKKIYLSLKSSVKRSIVPWPWRRGRGLQPVEWDCTLSMGKSYNRSQTLHCLFWQLLSVKGTFHPKTKILSWFIIYSMWNTKIFWDMSVAVVWNNMVVGKWWKNFPFLHFGCLVKIDGFPESKIVTRGNVRTLRHRIDLENNPPLLTDGTWLALLLGLGFLTSIVQFFHFFWLVVQSPTGGHLHCLLDYYIAPFWQAAVWKTHQGLSRLPPSQPVHDRLKLHINKLMWRAWR